MLQRRCQGEETVRLHTGGGDDVRHPGTALGDGTGLIQNHGLDGVGVLQRLGGLEQNAVFRAFSGPHHDCHRGGKTQGAGAGDYQHRYADGQGELKGLPQQHPDHKGKDRNADNRRDEYTADFVRQLGNGGLGVAGLLHQPDDLGEGGVVPNLLRPESEIARFIDGGGDYLVTLRLFHRDAFPGDGGFVHRRRAGQDFPVHRDALPRTDRQSIPWTDLLHRNDSFHAVPDDRRCFGSKVHQAGNCLAGAALGAGLQEFAQGD